MNSGSYHAPIKEWLVNEITAVVEKRLSIAGQVNRRDIIEMFNVSDVTASRYLRAYKESNPGVIRYDGNRRAYIPANSDVALRFMSIRRELINKEIMTVMIWLNKEHEKEIAALGRDPTQYSSKFSDTADALAVCIIRSSHADK